MQVPTKEIELFIILITAVFILAPLTLVLLVSHYNRRKKKHNEEKTKMQQEYEMEIAKARIEVHEQTLQTVGADLHDHIGQLLSLTNLTLKSVDEQQPEKTKEKVTAAINLTSKSIQELRLLGKLLEGEQLIKDGLVESIQYELVWLEKLDRLKIELIESPTFPNSALESNRELMVFRIFQEIVNNILKHAEASLMTVHIHYLPETFELKISDNGIGFDLDKTLALSSQMGLFNIQHRAKLINGSADIQSSLGQGTTITIRVPYDLIHENVVD